ncbi:hypothetical protein ABLE92_24445 [Gordonia sp. VNQ95]|uniref:hypothetical protein n=1 Tax=Gordonia sp. VNQ95 TaxID=3156619 RepID=UPI0032B33404
MTELTEADARLLVFVLAEFERRRRIAGQPVPAAARTLRQRLLVSANGPATGPAPAHSKPEQIDSCQAAAILGCNTRHVRRIAADLDGRRIGRRWIFHRHNVIDYREGKTP